MPIKPRNDGVCALAAKSGYSKGQVSKKLAQGKTPEEIVREAAERRLREAEEAIVSNRRRETPGEKETFADAQRRKESALADLRELEIAEKKKELIPAGDVQSAWVALATKVKHAILAIPDKLAPGVTGLTDPMEAKALLMRECELILRALHGDLNPENL